MPPEVKARISVEAGISLGWERWVGDRGSIISIEKFGASAPSEVLFQEYGLTVNNIIKQAEKLL
jgi:transketolase